MAAARVTRISARLVWSHRKPARIEEGPHQIELLLDGQRPQVPEGRRRAELGEVGDVVEDVPPVAHVEDSRRQVAPQGHQLAPVEQRGPAHGHEQHDEEGGQEPSRPTDPEMLQPDPAVAPVLGHQEIGDQVSREHEEDLHAEQPARRPPEVEVVGDHGQHGHGTDPVQPRQVGAGSLDRSRHGAPASGRRPPGSVVRHGCRPRGGARPTLHRASRSDQDGCGGIERWGSLP